jgi:E3 ubiquitin-protein ligase HUWE1
MLTTAHLASDEIAQSSLFLFEPDLIPELARILPRYDSMGTAALLALDACANHRAKFPEVLTALGANVSHGGLMSLFRGVVERLDTNSIPDSLVDALYAFIARVVNSSGPNGQLLISAGLFPILLSMLATECDRRDNVSSLIGEAYGSISLEPLVSSITSFMRIRMPCRTLAP